jgi:hypothetical protein
VTPATVGRVRIDDERVRLADPDQMDTLEGNILSDQMDISDDDQMDWQVVEPLARGMTNLQIGGVKKLIRFFFFFF